MPSGSANNSNCTISVINSDDGDGVTSNGTVYFSNGPNERSATYTVSSGESIQTTMIDDIEATPVYNITSLSNSYNLPVDEDFWSQKALFSVAAGVGNAEFIGVGLPALSISLSTNSLSTQTPVDEDFAANGAYFTFVVGKAPLRALADNEVSTGNGVSTVQIWRTG